MDTLIDIDGNSIKNVNIDYSKLKIDKNAIVKAKDKFGITKNYCKLNNSTLDVKEIIISGFSFDDSLKSSKVSYCCNDLKIAEYDSDLYEAKLSTALNYNVDNL